MNCYKKLIGSLFFASKLFVNNPRSYNEIFVYSFTLSLFRFLFRKTEIYFGKPKIIMYLDRILGSKTKINILSVLTSNDDKEFMESELASKVGCSLSEVNRQIVDLVNCGLVEMKKVGRAKVYSVNKRHFLFKALKILFQDLTKVYSKAAKEIARFITKKYKVFAVILFGSLVRGKIRSDFVREPSDIDLIIVARKDDVKNVKNELISFINEKIFSKYGIVAYPIVISLEDYRNSLIHNDPLIVDVHANGEVLYGEKPKIFS